MSLPTQLHDSYLNGIITMRLTDDLRTIISPCAPPLIITDNNYSHCREVFTESELVDIYNLTKGSNS